MQLPLETQKMRKKAYRIKTTQLKEPGIFFQWMLLIMVLAGGFATLKLFNWWFISLHYKSLLYFSLTSFFIWTGILRMNWNWYQLIRIKKQPTPTNPSKPFSVAIFTTAAPGEPIEMFEKTFKAFHQIKHPCQIYFLDGTNDPSFKNLAFQYGLNHLDMSTVQGAKAGKVNEALKITKEDLILILDPDHIIFPDFFVYILPYFNDDKIGFVQPSQGYYNQNRSHVALGAAEQTYLFYGPTQIYYGSVNQAIAIGANCVFRRTALESIGGHATGLAEDLQTSVRLHAQGWTSKYIPYILNRGLVPEDFDSFAKQQLKWARGLFELAFEEFPLLFKQLKFRSKIQYAFIATYYLFGIRIFYFLMIPVIYYMFKIEPVVIPFVEFLSEALPLIIIAFIVYEMSKVYLCDRHTERGFYWRSLGLKIASWPIFVYALYLTLIRKKIPYIPTAKRGGNRLSIFIIPLILYCFLLLASMFYYYVFEPNEVFNSTTSFGMFFFSILALIQHLIAFSIIFSKIHDSNKDAWDKLNIT